METKKNNLLVVASVIIVVCAVVASIVSVVNVNKSLNSMSDLTAEEQALVEAQMNEAGVTMEQATGLVSGVAYAGVGFIIIVNILKVVIGILGFMKADKSYKFYTIWGIVLLVFGVFGLIGGIFTVLGICNLLAGIVAPILFIVGGSQNKKALAG